MKILKLHFQNINSLGGQHIIDFQQSPFIDTGIFAITGATGSGKSTILDAITLALYNQTPRSGKVSKGEIANHGSIITNNALAAFAEIEYLSKGKFYRSRWQIHRTKSSGVLQDYKMEISNAEGVIMDLKKSQVPSENTKIIGLDFEQFSKSVLLSQGEFAKFLKAGINERSALLEKITGTDIYRKIGKASFERKKEEQLKLSSLEVQLSGINLLEDDEITSQELEKKQIETTLPNLNKSAKELRTFISRKLQILELTNEKQKNEVELIVLEKAKNELNPQIKKLELHQKALPLKSNITQLKGLIAKISEAKLLKAQLANKATDLEKSISNLNTALEAAKKTAAFLKHDFETRQNPSIVKARELLTEIDTKKAIISTIENKISTKKETLKTLNSTIERLTTSLLALKKEKETTSDYLEKNTLLKELPEILPLIADRETAKNTTEESAKNELKKLSEKIRFNVLTPFSDYEFWTKNITEELNIQKAKIKHLAPKAAASEHNDNVILEELQNLKAKFQELENLKRFALEIDENKTAIIESETRYEQALKNKSVNQELLQKNKNEMQILELQLKELNIRKDRENMESSFKDARLKLEKNTPCFLCGALEHPYKEHYTENKNRTKALIEKAEKAEKKQLADISKLEKEISTLDANTKNEQQNIKNLKVKTEDLFKKFSTINTKNSFTCLPENISTIENQKVRIKENGKVLKAVMQARYEITKLKGTISALNYSLEAVKVAQVKRQEFQMLISKFSDYLASDKNILATLKTHNNQFILASTTDAQITNSITENELVINEKKEQANLISADLDKDILQEKLNINDLQQSTNHYQLCLSSIFKAKQDKANLSVVSAEKYIRASIEKATEEVSNITLKLSKLYENQTNTKNKIKELITEKQADNLKKSEIQTILLTKIQSLGLADISQAEQAILSPETCNIIELKKNKNEKELISISTKLAENKIKIEALLKLTNAEKKEEDLKLDLQNIEQKISTSTKRDGEISAVLKAEKEKRRNSDALLKTIKNQKVEYQKWATLAEYIGDSEGKKYVKFAQGLTLIQLVKLANKHLEKLYPRYKIKVKTSDNEIVIIDTYLADSERSVKTLSGGESFMASLALALGLSDLAGKDTKIDCLFIDEGFGTLDADALETALTALENLQAQTNRTIGIISHVQALKDRIPVQIRLRKLGSGHSKFSIFDGNRELVPNKIANV